MNMKIECPECCTTFAFRGFLEHPSECVCSVCGKCFDLEANLVYQDGSNGDHDEFEMSLEE